ncbi:hypothetical protein BDZ89DRAFT_1141053 [Hymenopellis radicata]|nr:hypothetical protein BDZ89DRAFT_1141053 [Hymenopellis radicata]
MVDQRQPKDGPDPDDHNEHDQEHPETEGGSEVDEDDIKTLTKGWLTKFSRNWLGGEALAYAKEHHLDEFCQQNRTSAADGTAYGLVAAKDMMREFGVFGPWGATSVRKEDEEEEEEDGRAYDDVDDLVDQKQATTGAKTGGKGESIQAREGQLLKAAHIECFRKSFLSWLRYQYKFHQGGDTLRGRGNAKSGRPGRTTRTTSRRSDDTEGEDLSRLLIHELLGLGQSTFHVPHAFQLWWKDQPRRSRKRFLKMYAESGKPKRKRAGAEMAYAAKKFRDCEDDVRETYNEKVGELREEAREKKQALREMFITRLDPKDAAKLLEAIPYVLDPLLTSLSAMLHAKLSLLIGVPEPTEGGVVTIKSFDKGENHDDDPATFGQTQHYARHVDAFKEFLNDAYTPEELRACAIPGSLPKSPKKGSAASQRSDGKKVVIVVQSMALPPGENWVTRKARLEDDEEEDEEPTLIEMRRLRKEKREAKAQRLAEDGPVAKRPRGRPRKRKAQEEDSEDEDEGRPSPAKKKKAMPEPAKKAGRAKSKRVSASTTTASGSTTLGDITTSRGRKQAQPKISENRRKLLALAADVQASSKSAGSRERTPTPPPPPPPAARQKPRLSRKRKQSEDDVDDDPPPPPPAARPKPRPSRKRKQSEDDVDDDPPPQSPTRPPPPPPARPKPRPSTQQTGTLSPIVEADENGGGGTPPDLEREDPIIDDLGFDLGVDEYELDNPKRASDEDEDDTLGLFSSPPRKRQRTPDKLSEARDPNSAAASSLPSGRPEARRKQRVPPTGDNRLRQAAKPPSTRAASVAPAPGPVNPFDERQWSDWFKLCHGQFECIGSPEWYNLLNLWTRVEAIAEFRLGSFILGYQSDLKPAALSDWVNTRRRKAISIPRRNLKSFAAEFWTWWIDLQPEWRDVAGFEGPLTEEHRRPAIGRDWGQLGEAKGRNGIVSVIACLAWWGVHHLVDSGPVALREQWRDAVDDVAYVLDGILDMEALRREGESV